MAALSDVTRLAAQLGVAFTDHGGAFDLEKPLALEGTSRKVQAGIDPAYGDLVRLHTRLGLVPSGRQRPARFSGPALRTFRKLGRGGEAASSEHW